MKLAIRSLVVLLAGCLLAVACYFALGSMPTSALGGARIGGRDGFRGQPPGGFVAGQSPENGAATPNTVAGAQSPAGPQELGRADGGRDGHGRRQGRGGGAGFVGMFMDLGQIVVVTLLVAMLGWVVRFLGDRRKEPAPDPV